MSSILGEMRRGLVINQGPGCIIDFRTDKGATISIIHPGLEYWDKYDEPEANDITIINEVRLQKLIEKKLQERYKNEASYYVNYFRLPPAEEKKKKNTKYQKNYKPRYLPGIRFPNFLKCPKCDLLKEADDWNNDGTGIEKICTDCSKPQDPIFVVPSRFLVSCPDGHISDFPWSNWLTHFSRYQGNCEHPGFKLKQTADTGLGGLQLTCTECSAKTNLGNLFSPDAWKEIGLKCNGNRPWLGDTEPCTHTPKPVLKGASNCYFPVTESIISIPPLENSSLDKYGFNVWNMVKNSTLEENIDFIRLSMKMNFPDIDAESIVRKFELISDYLTGDVNKDPLVEEFLRITDTDEQWDETQNDYEHFQKENMEVPTEISKYIDKLVKVEKLREVKALIAFKRINQPYDSSTSGKGLFASLSKEIKHWYPAVEVFGEGLFFSLNLNKIKEWEQNPQIKQRAKELNNIWKEEWSKQTTYQGTTNIPDASPIITPRFLLIHTLSHAFINQLALDSGYNTASLKERIYCSDKTGEEMAGVLIYTSASDSEGTLGSLSEKAEPSLFLPIFQQAVHNQSICSNDPICSDGISSLSETFNPSACHSCLLLPETSCVHFNRFLDRTTLIGNPFDTTKNNIEGFFEDFSN